MFLMKVRDVYRQLLCRAVDGVPLLHLAGLSQTRGGTRTEVGHKFVAVLHGQQARVSRLHIDRRKPHQEGGEARRLEGFRNGWHASWDAQEHEKDTNEANVQRPPSSLPGSLPA